jgi:hypothetical protein
MDRSAALTYLTQNFRELATEVQFTDEQRSDAYSAAMDMSLRDLGYAESDLSAADVEQANVRKYLALLDYYALKRFSRVLSTRVAVSLPGPVSKQANQAFAQVQALLAQAKQELADLGVDIGGTASFKFGRLNLGFLSHRRREEWCDDNSLWC